jgi:PAS domain-containing protein/two-component sensor histidine kinase
MVTLVNGVFGVGILVGVSLCLLGYYTYSRCDEVGVTAFAVFAATLGLTAVAGGALGITGATILDGAEVWSVAALAVWAFSTVPWVVFAVQYTGRLVEIRRRTALLLAVPHLGLVLAFGRILRSEQVTLSNLLISLVIIYSLALALVGVYLLSRTTYTYGQFSVLQGVTLSVAPLGTLLMLNSLGMLPSDLELVNATLFTGTFSVVALVLGLAVVRLRVFAASPAAGTLGERTMLRETDDIVLVVDSLDRPLRLNETALETLGVTRAEAFETDLSALLGYDTDTLQERETVSLDTTEGTRRYDPQVSVLARQGRELGVLLDLRDVTDRELREQRLSVLNRVLRHNLRNKVEVLKARTEVLDEDLDGEYTTHTETLGRTAEEIAELGRNARRIDQVVAEESRETDVDVVATVSETLEDIDTDGSGIAVGFDTPDRLRIETNRRALTAALRSALENAVTYAESEVTVTVEQHSRGCTVRIDDDGPGIPEGELASLDSGVETPLRHSTGLGLWQLKWAVTTLGGELSFDTTDGTTVEMTLPDREPGD